MRKAIIVILTVGVLSSCCCGGGFRKAEAPVAMKKEHVREIHGDRVEDPYYWMYDYFGQGPDSSNVVAYLEAENAYTAEVMKCTEPLQKKLYKEMRGRIKETDMAVPTLNNGYYYYTRTEKGKEYYKYCRKKGSLDAPEEVVFDVDEMAEGYAYYSLASAYVSPDNKLMAYSIDTVSRRQYEIRIKNLETGEILPDRITAGTTGQITWANDNKTIYYTAKNPFTLTPERVMRHELGTPEEADVLVYAEKDNTNYISVYKSKNMEHIFVESSGTLSSEVYLLDPNDPAVPLRSFQPRVENVLYEVVPLEDRFLILTNMDAENFRVMTCPLDRTGVKYWKEFIPHREDVLLFYIEEFKDYIVLAEQNEGLRQLHIKNLKDEKDYYLDFGEPVYVAGIAANYEYDTDILRYRYSSMTTPSSLYDYNMATGDKILLKQTEVLGGFDKDNYVSERLYATARDGARVPISIVYRKGFEKDGNAPLLMYGYGSYGNIYDPGFMRNQLSLLDRGFACAIAHIRGGQEMGRQWYEDGKMHNKINTFTDFIDCAEYLIAENYTSPSHLYANGGSAGGLLMGAIANMRPDLWNGIVADVPFVDVINTMLDEDIPLTTGEYDEWGNPNKKEDYFYMKSYSPYENVECKEYPNMLVTTGLHDSQVQYFEPAKWVAKLRDMKTDDNILLLHTNMDVGHGGASGRFDYLKEVAMEYAFYLTLEEASKK